MANLSIGMLIKPDADDEVIEEAIALVCKYLKSEKAPIVFGRIENDETSTVRDAWVALKRLRMMIRELLQNTSWRLL